MFLPVGQANTAWPVAPFTLVADSGKPGPDYWLRMDPVHMKVDFKGGTLTEAHRLGISAAEAGRLCSDLNAHFSDAPWRIEALHPSRWYVRLQTEPDLTCPPPEAFVGQPITDMPPFGEDGAVWRAVATEIQMLFNAHEVNKQREANGLYPLNSVWIWGGGRLPPPPGQSSPWDLVVGGDERVRGLADWSRTSTESLPENALEWLDRNQGLNAVLLVLDSLSDRVGKGDVEVWREQQGWIDRHWMGPLLEAIRLHRVKHLTVVTETAKIGFSRFCFAKFWRPKRSLAGCMRNP